MFSIEEIVRMNAAVTRREAERQQPTPADLTPAERVRLMTVRPCPYRDTADPVTPEWRWN
jgi:hypothetical protein